MTTTACLTYRGFFAETADNDHRVHRLTGFHFGILSHEDRSGAASIQVASGSSAEGSFVTDFSGRHAGRGDDLSKHPHPILGMGSRPERQTADGGNQHQPETL